MKTEHKLSPMQEFTESMFYAAFLKADEERGRAILEEEADEKKELSNEERRRLQRQISAVLARMRLRRACQVMLVVSRRAAILIGILLLIGVTLMATVEAVREKVAELLFGFQPGHVELELEPSGGLKAEGYPLPTFEFSYIPKGFTPYDSEDAEERAAMGIFIYENSEEEYIHCNICTASTRMSVNTEGANRIEKCVIRGNEGMLIEDDGRIALIWSEDLYYFVLDARLSENELYRIAEGIQVK